jgi:uncharacterized protein YutE (UPF0331/DUF86 family)
VTDPLLVLRKLSLLREHLDRVRRRRPPSVDTLRDDVDRQDALAMSLLVAVQEAVDIAMHVAADEAWGLPPSHAGAFDLLASHGVISPAHARELAGTVAVRNRIAHGYASVDLERLWAELPAGLETLERFAEAIAAYVDRAQP